MVLYSTFTILIVKGVRKVPLEYPKQMVAGGAINKVQGGGRRYLPLKIAMAGVMPIIFAQAIMFLPTGLASSDFLGEGAKGVMTEIGNPNSVWYNITSCTYCGDDVFLHCYGCKSSSNGRRL